jgi:hypothetical protein
MIDLELAKILRARLASQFGCYVGAPLAVESIILPAILLEIESEVVVGSVLQRGTLKVAVQSSADDSTADTHALFAKSVDLFLRAQTVEEAGVKMWAPVATRASNATGDRHWETSLEYVLGMEAI